MGLIEVIKYGFDMVKKFQQKTPRKIEVRDDYAIDYDDDLFEMIDDVQYESNIDLIKFQSLLNDAEKSIYLGCTRFTKLSTLLRLYNSKRKYGWSDKSFSKFLYLLGELLLKNNEMPSSFYEVKKTLYSLECLIRKYLHAQMITYYIIMLAEKRNSEKVRNGVLSKLLWYIQPILCFLRLFQNLENAKNLTWHANERIDDGKLRHHIDSPTWKKIDWK